VRILGSRALARIEYCCVDGDDSSNMLEGEKRAFVPRIEIVPKIERCVTKENQEIYL